MSEKIEVKDAPKRKIVNIVSDKNWHTVALCDDGTVWRTSGGNTVFNKKPKWKEVNIDKVLHNESKCVVNLEGKS